VSSGSACTSASLEPSYVLRALGVEEDMAHTSIRWGDAARQFRASLQHALVGALLQYTFLLACVLSICRCTRLLSYGTVLAALRVLRCAAS
jgi:hypothetical protein